MVMASIRNYIFCSATSLCVWLGLASGCWASQSAAPAKHHFRKGVVYFQRGEFQRAKEYLQTALQKLPNDEGVRYYLARAYLKLGDQKQNFTRQRHYYKQALDVDPRLLEDSSFVKRYRSLQTERGAASASLQRKQAPRVSPKRRLFSLGVGLVGGVEGLLGVQTGLMIAGVVVPLFTFLPVQQSFDFSLRILPLRRFNWSPFLSAGVNIPLNRNSIHPIPKYREPFLHVAIGVQYVAPIGFSFASGISLSYHFEKPAEFSFIPVPSVHFSWHF